MNDRERHAVNSWWYSDGIDCWRCKVCQRLKTEAHHDACPLAEILRVLDSIDEWLGNSEGLMTEDVIAWREALAKPLGRRPDSWLARSVISSCADPETP